MAHTKFINQTRVAQQPLSLSCATPKSPGSQSALVTSSKNILTTDGADGRAFKSLSRELHQLIIEFLPHDSDIANYARICLAASAAVTTSVWRKRFLHKYDQNHGETNQEIFKKYKYRHLVSNAYTVFNLKRYGGRLTDETYETQLFNQNNWLHLLRTLIIESDARNVVDAKGCEIIEGRNLKFIRDMISDTGNGRYIDLIDAIFNTETNFDIKDVVSAGKNDTLVFVIQLILTPISLHPDFCNARISHFDLSQAQAYATSGAQPIFIGSYLQNINVMWLLNVVNFFKLHLKTAAEGLLSYAYDSLEPYQYPQPWTGRIKAGTQPLGNFWKGCHMYMDDIELSNLRNRTAHNNGIYSDSLDLGETFQNIEIFFDEKRFPSHAWPTDWDDVLLSDPFRPTASSLSCRRSRRNMPTTPEILNFYGMSEGDKIGYFFGRIHGMPHQQGFHGFQRITFRLFYHPEEEPSIDQMVYNYEGCVLPGGRFIVGRWWDIYADPREIATMSGPFIWWNIDQTALDSPCDRDDIIRFLKCNS